MQKDIKYGLSKLLKKGPNVNPHLRWLEISHSSLKVKLATIKTLADNRKPDEEFLNYLLGLYYYLSGNTAELSLLIQTLNTRLKLTRIQKLYLPILKLRLEIRKHDLENIKLEFFNLQKLEHEIESSEKLMTSINDLQGELYFVLARACELLSNNEKAIQYYQLAAEVYKSQGLYRKQCKSMFNALICEEHDQTNIAVAKHQELLRIAIKQRDRSVLGTILNNIAFRLLFLGAYHSAEKLISHSLSFLNYESNGLNFHVANLNLCHIYFLLGKKNLFFQTLDTLRTSPFTEVRETTILLDNYVRKNLRTQHDKYLTQGWLWRIKKELSSLSKLTPLEDDLVGFLALAPRSRNEIIKFLWPSFSDLDILNSRFKRVIARLKLKRPGLVFYEQSTYQIRINTQGSITQITAQNKKNQGDSNVELALTGYELKLKTLLESQAMGFYDLTEKIYGTKISSEKSANRLKNLLARIRKKYPFKLHIQKGKYYWS
jgi:tetratricopeptide (TPR) repeat protein